MKIEISPKNLEWVMRVFMQAFVNTPADSYRHVAFELVTNIVDSSEMTEEEKSEFMDGMWLIAFPKGLIARRIREKRNSISQ